MTQPYIFSFAHLPTIRAKFPASSSTGSDHSFEGSVDAPPEFDFIVVGGGPSGCALATRLYERTRGQYSVLLIEAGPHPSANPELGNCVPRILQTRTLHGSAYDYAYRTERAGQYGKRDLIINSGKVLGGSTCINFAIWTRGAKADYDLWAAQSGSTELSWEKMKPCFERVNSVGGPIHTRRVSDTPRNHYWSSIARSGLEENGYKPLQDLDLNQGLLPSAEAETDHDNSNSNSHPLRVFGEITECLDDDLDATRCTAIKYFERVVDPMLQTTTGTNGDDSQKFEVWTSLRVEKVVFQGAGVAGDGVKAVGVQTRHGIVRAKQEVILTAGAIQSPYILLLSGIGPAEHLSSRGVSVVRDVPGVGQNLWEHPFVDVRAKIRPSQRKETVETFASLKTSAEHMHRWATQGTGLMSGLLYEWLAYSNMKPEVEEALKDAALTTSKTDSRVLLRSTIPHVEHFIHYGHGLTPAPDPLASSYIGVSCVLLVPRSRGVVEIPAPEVESVSSSSPIRPDVQGVAATATATTTTDPNNDNLTVPQSPLHQHPEHPRIQVNQLADPVDRAIMRSAVRRACEILRAPAWDAYLDLESLSEKEGDLDRIVRERVSTLWHLGGTCSMTTQDIDIGGGVVDAEFRVVGVKGLRVADTSVIPFPIVAHTQAVGYALGEKVAEVLARQYGF